MSSLNDAIEGKACRFEDPKLGRALACEGVLDATKVSWDWGDKVLNFLDLKDPPACEDLFKKLIDGNKTDKRIIKLNGGTIGLNGKDKIQIGDKIFNSHIDLNHFFYEPYNSGIIDRDYEGFGCLRHEKAHTINNFWNINRQKYFEYLEQKYSDKLCPKNFESLGLKNVALATIKQPNIFQYVPVKQVHNELGTECGGSVVADALMYTGLIRSTLDRESFELNHTSMWDEIYLYEMINSRHKTYTDFDIAKIGSILNRRKRIIYDEKHAAITDQKMISKRLCLNYKEVPEILPREYNIYFRGTPGNASFPIYAIQNIIDILKNSDWSKLMGMDEKTIKVKKISDPVNCKTTKKITDQNAFVAYMSLQGEIYSDAAHWVGIHGIEEAAVLDKNEKIVDMLKRLNIQDDDFKRSQGISELPKGTIIYKIYFVDNFPASNKFKIKYYPDKLFSVNTKAGIESSYFDWTIQIS